MILTYIPVYVYQCIEMVEHDTPPEEREPVLEEPHMKKEEEGEKEKEGSEGESKTAEDVGQPASEGAAGQTQPQPSYAGMSTFFSGIASMVQTTVSPTSYHMDRKFSEDFNLAVWRIDRPTTKSKYQCT